ncbi:hypothetical protein C1J03_01580 [Sulfitobacter sp. SK012]|uniref:DUF2798 domain-containing protein n=1 Tax=Sulfitobacter sp. SK012 TaxID=1389005 RepID=UPI000E0B291B|nr:DUF2798 domain-containing protein [Sulfitobacter sp. SK012]AXI44837.1 hypothetical protein C1J03_01580 [Sulfitobacter sp. SK012]
MIPARYATVLFGFILSGLMSLMVSGIVTYRTVDTMTGFVGQWLGAWLPNWMVAFPTVLIVAPLARRLVMTLVRKE